MLSFLPAVPIKDHKESWGVPALHTPRQKEDGMDFFPWKEEYSVGIKKFDDQHKSLVGFLNELYEAMNDGKGKDSLGKVLSNLVQYTKTHFTSEEALMKLYDYPEQAAHKQKHESMAGHVLRLVKKFEEGDISNPVQITNFLKEWLAKHILETDKAYGPYLREKGVS